ncbi:MAG: LysR family transcriptional regulator [Piscinibacter sp.]|uniref:LysR substrate-binding domain-containing protein n=1 Tax=Piscinibacter sp. TaxID=1903157 RepID=UPI0025844456|nr:LysR substrate-binding domain-containing protein [Piscinibacter sp.]MCW5666782.1 LysR family transcriptional regulator [Piscinibacter sp.]
MPKPVDRLPPLDLLVTFEAAARQLSFTRAADERFLTQSAVSRQVRALEEDLGVALFRRGHRRIELTEPGRRLHGACSELIGSLRRTVASIRAPARRETLALTTTPGFASLWLIPRLADFTREHPGVDVRLDASFETRGLRAEGFDLAIRYGRPGHVEGRQVFAEAILPVCSPKLLRQAPLARPADLRQHVLLQVVGQGGAGMPVEWGPWLQAAGLPDLQPRATLSFSGYGEAIAAALAGQGVALGRRPLVDTLLKRRQLVTPFEGSTASSRAYFLLVEPGARERPAVRAFEAWLLKQAQA